MNEDISNCFYVTYSHVEVPARLTTEQREKNLKRWTSHDFNK